MKRLPRALLTLLAVLTLCACGDKAQDGSNGEDAAVAWDALSFDKSMPLDYAAQFSVSYAGDEYKRITVGQDQEFLLVAEGAAVPGGVPEGVTVLQQPLDEIYLVASAAMDSFAQLDAVDCIRFSGRKESDCSCWISAPMPTAGCWTLRTSGRPRSTAESEQKRSGMR